MRRYAFEALVTHLSWLIFIFIFTDGLSQPFSVWLHGFDQWDARWYSSIAMDGHGLLPQTYAFPPLHGWLLGRLTYFIFDGARSLGFQVVWMHIFVPVAFVTGVLFFALANTILVILAERRWQMPRGRLWVIAVSNPVGYFALTAYSDSAFYLATMLVLLLATWTSDRREAWKLPVLSMKQERFFRVSLFALLFAAPWIRLTGFAFAILAFLRRREVIGVLLSLTCYLLYMKAETDDPFFFLNVQRAFDMPSGTIVSGFIMSCEILTAFFSGQAYQGGDFFLYSMNFGFFPLICLAFSICLVLWLKRRDENQWALVALAITLVSHNQAFWRSTIRYALPLFPMMYWMLFAKAPTAPRFKRWSPNLALIPLAMAVGLSLAFQVFYSRLFRAAGWAF